MQHCKLHHILCLGRKVLSLDLKGSKDAGDFRQTACAYGPSLKYGSEQSFFFHWYVDKRTQNNKPFTERIVIIIKVLAYMYPLNSNSFVIFYVISDFKKFPCLIND